MLVRLDVRVVAKEDAIIFDKHDVAARLNDVLIDHTKHDEVIDWRVVSVEVHRPTYSMDEEI